MKQITLLVNLVLALFITGCANMNFGGDSDTADIKVETKTDPKANLSGYKTYRWIAAGAVLRDPEAKWQPPGFSAGAHVKDSVDDKMIAKGFKLDLDNADLGAAYFIGINMDAHKLKQNPETKEEELLDVPQGALVVVLVDMRSGYVVWVGRAIGESPVNEKGENIVDNERIRKRLDYAVTEMFVGLDREKSQSSTGSY